MKNLIKLLFILILFYGCKTPEIITLTEYQNHTIKEYIRDTIIDVQIKPMYVEKQTLDTLSELSTNNAFSRAFISSGTLYHSLEQKGVQPTKIVYKEKIIIDTIYKTKTSTKEVEKRLSSIQNFFIVFGKLCIILFILLVLIYYKNKK
jgi:hypothetical protein